MGVAVKKSGPGIKGLEQSLQKLRGSDILVGIPQQTTLRKGQAINNAGLMFVLTHGSPVRNIPATPIVEPGVKKSAPLYSPHLAAAAKAILDKDPAKARQELDLAGTIAANGVKRYFTDSGNGWPPNAPSTIRRKGSNRRNIDTGALRGAVTHVVRIKGEEAAPAASSGIAVETAEALP